MMIMIWRTSDVPSHKLASWIITLDGRLQDCIHIVLKVCSVGGLGKVQQGGFKIVWWGRLLTSKNLTKWNSLLTICICHDENYKLLCFLISLFVSLIYQQHIKRLKKVLQRTREIRTGNTLVIICHKEPDPACFISVFRFDRRFPAGFLTSFNHCDADVYIFFLSGFNFFDKRGWLWNCLLWIRLAIRPTSWFIVLSSSRWIKLTIESGDFSLEMILARAIVDERLFLLPLTIFWYLCQQWLWLKQHTTSF